MISFGTDVADLILQRTLYDNTLGLNSSIERMTSGYKVNHAKDNAANFSIITDLNTQISSMLQVQQNAEDGLSMLQTAEGGLAEIEELLQRLRSLATQASNGNYGAQSREAMQAEADEIIEQIAQIRESMKFNGMNVYYTPREEEVTTTSIGEAAVNRLAGAVRIESKNSNKSENLIKETYIQNPAGEGNTSAPASSYTPTVMRAPSDGTNANNTIEGAEAFNGSETRTITIDGVEYTIKNRLTTANDLSYIKDTTIGEITFIGSNFEIRAQSDIKHNLVISGKNNFVYGGDLSDIITLNGNLSVNNYIYGGMGDDVFNSNVASRYNYIYGQDGDDTINANKMTITYGGSGNDVFNIYAGGTHYGGDGEDTFNVFQGSIAATINGGSGTNSVNDNGTGTVKINVPGANTYAVAFNARETQKLMINGIEYTITNNTNAQDFVYSIADNGQIDFKSENFTIRGDVNKAHNVKISADSIIFYGSELADTIVMANRVSRVYALGGDDNITLGSYNLVYSGEGNDTITVVSGAKSISLYDEAGDDTLVLSGNNSMSYFDTGVGDDNVVIAGSNCRELAITGASGNNTITGTVSNSIIDGFDDTDNTFYVNLAAGETKVVEINGKKYTITNNANAGGSIIYYYNPVDGKISFGCSNSTVIRAQEEVSHDIVLYGRSITFYGGNLDDKIENYAYGASILGQDGNDTIIDYARDGRIYGENGDDHISLVRGASNIFGGDGNDIIDINTTLSLHVINGEGGDDVYNINAACAINDTGGNNIYNINTDGASISGSSGNDTFYINGDNNTVLGAGGDDYFVIDGDNNVVDGGTGNNYYVNNGSGTNFTNVSRDPNSGGLSFTYLGETKTFTLNGKTYTVTNNLSGSNMLQYSLNPNTGVITLNGSGFQIDAASNESAILNIRGDNNTINGSNLADRITVEQGSNNIINGLSGNDNLIMNSANNSLNGGDGDDTITLNESTNLAVTGGAGGDTITVNSDNNTNIDAGAGDNRIVIEGSQNNISADDGNNTITINTDSNTINTGDGANRFVVNGSSNTVTAGSGANIIGVQGDNNNLNAQNAIGTINIYGNENTITNTRGENDVIIRGDGNNYSTTVGDKNVTVTGDNNEILTGSGNDRLEIRGDGNTVESISGDNEFTVRGDGNTIQGGNGVDDISLNGNNNFANGGDTNDSFMISGGNNNTIDGNGGGRNTMINNGNNTQYSNVVDITPRPFDVNIKVDIGSGSDKFISTQISFNLFDFSVDFSSQESALESLEDIDNLIKDVQDQLLNIGTTINRLETVIEAQGLKMNNLISTRSTLRDADVAEESSNYIRYQILQQASATLMSASRGLRSENILGLIGSVNV